MPYCTSGVNIVMRLENTSGRGAGEASGVGAPIDPELTADAEEGGDVGPLGAGAGTSLHRQSPPRAPAHRAVGRLSAGAPRLHKSCRWRRPQSKGRSCVVWIYFRFYVSVFR